MRSIFEASLAIAATTCLCLTGWSCGKAPSAPVPKNSSGTPTPNTGVGDAKARLSETIQLLTDEEQQLLVRQKAEAAEFRLLQVVNQRLCERLQRYRSECVPSLRLDGSANDKVLGCVGNFEDDNRLKLVWSIKLGGNQDLSYKIIAGDYESTTLDSGKNTSFQWIATGATDVQAPQLSELSDLKLKLITPNAILPAVGNMSIEMRVNDSIVPLTLLENTGSLNSFKLDRTLLLELRKSEKCRVPLSDLDEITTKVKREFAAQPAIVGEGN